MVVTIYVKSLYTSILNNEGIDYLKKKYDFYRKRPYLLRLRLEENKFRELTT